MDKITEKLLKFRFLVLGIFGLVIGLSVIGILNVNINSNIMDYLPQDMDSVEGAKIIQEEFNDSRTIKLLVQTGDTTVQAEVKTAVEGLTDWVTSVDTMDKKDGEAILYSLSVTAEFNSDDIAPLSSAISKILADKKVKGGIASGTMNVTTTIDSSLMMGATLAVIIFVIAIFSKSFFDIFIILGTIGVAILINMGTNIFLGSVSAMTMSAASLIQLAVSIDYALFILNNYRQATEKGMGIDEALPYAVKKSAKSVLAGAITTIAGFAALMFMQLELGKDMGLVLAKGIVISIITALVLVPILIKVFNKAVVKLEHRNFIPSISFFGKHVGKVKSSAVLVLLLGATVGGYIMQDRIGFIYGEPPMTESEGYIYDNFVDDINMVVLYENGTDGAKYMEFITKVNTDLGDKLIKQGGIASWELIGTDFTNAVNGCAANVQVACDSLPLFGIDAQTIAALQAGYIQPADLINPFKANFVGKNHTRTILTFASKANGESEEKFLLVQTLRDIVKQTLGEDAKVVGKEPMVYDMRDLNNKDYVVVTLISIIAVGLVIALAFKSISIPLLLVLVIQGAIWVNIAISAVTGDQLIFMGVIIVSSIQLGATIDYSILLTEKYEHNRLHEGMDKKAAIFDAAKNSTKSILTSGIALTVAGFVMAFIQKGTVGQMGLLLGRGALVSMLISLIAIPHVLYLFDKVIWKTTYTKKDHLL